MSFEIHYNGIQIASGQPAPLLQRDVDYIQAGERWGQMESYTLNGYLTGCSDSDLISARNSLLQNFSSGFGSLTIAGFTGFDLVKIRDVSFEDSQYVGPLGYSISFEHYPSGAFETFYGVLEPSDVIQYRENQDQTLEMSRTISAKGFATSLDLDSALNNAVAFVESRSGEMVKPFLIDYSGTNLAFYLDSSDENIDRLNNSVTLSQVFRCDPLAVDSSIIHRFSYDVKEDVAQLMTITFNGQIDAGRYGSLSGCRNVYDKFKSGMGSRFFINESVTEDDFSNKLIYGISLYTGSGTAGLDQVEDDFSITISEDSESSIIKASVNGGILAKYGCRQDRIDAVASRFLSVSGSNFHADLVKEIYEDFYTIDRGGAQAVPDGVFIRPSPFSYQKSQNNTEQIVSYSASFDDRFLPPGITEPNADCVESLSVKLPISEVAINEHYKGGLYSVQDLGYVSKEAMGISVNLTKSTGQISGWAINLMNSFSLNEEASYPSNDQVSNSSTDKGGSYSISKSYKNNVGEYSV